MHVSSSLELAQCPVLVISVLPFLLHPSQTEPPHLTAGGRKRMREEVRVGRNRDRERGRRGGQKEEREGAKKGEERRCDGDE